MFGILHVLIPRGSPSQSRQSLQLSRFVSTVALLCLLFASPVHAQVDDSAAAENGFFDRIERQLSKVWSLARETTARVFGGGLIQVAQVNTPFTEPITIDDISPTVLTSLGALNGENLEAIVFNTPVRVAGQFVVSEGVTRLGSTTVSGTLTVDDLELETLSVALSTVLNTLTVTGDAQLNGSVTTAGSLAATGGITTGGADVDLEGGQLFASNVLNGLTAGENITISGTTNQPIIAAEFAGVTSINDETGDVDFTGRDDIRVSGTTIRNQSTLDSVVTRGSCVDCITDEATVDALTVSGGVIDDTIIGATTQAAGYFTSLAVGTTTAASGTLRVANDVVVGNALTVLGTGTTTFSNTINLTDGCFAINGTCVVGGALTTYLGLTDTPGSYLAGALPYANAGATGLTQSNNLVFDGTRLGVGTSTNLTARLSVQATGTADILNLLETGGQEVLTVLENGNVGVGTTTPASSLDIFSTASALNVGNTGYIDFYDAGDIDMRNVSLNSLVTGQPGDYDTVNLSVGTQINLTSGNSNEENIGIANVVRVMAGSATSGSMVGLFNATGDYGSGADVHYGINNEAINYAGNTSHLRGINSYVDNYAVATTLAGAYIQGWNSASSSYTTGLYSRGGAWYASSTMETLDGVISYGDTYGSDVDLLRALRVRATISDGSAVATVHGAEVRVIGDNSAVNDLRGLTIGIDTSGGLTATSTYGLYIEDIVSTNPYALYQAGANDQNYFAGNVGIGTSTPATKLSVVGTTTLTGGLLVTNATSTFSGDINLLGGCVAYNGTCIESVSTLNELTDVTLTAPGNGDFLQYDGSDWVNVASTSIGLGDGTFTGLTDTPGSYLAGALPYANAGATGLTQSANLTFNGSTLTVDGTVSLADRNTLRFYETGSTNYVGFRASSSIASDQVWTLPDSDGAADTILVTDGSGNLRFAPVGTVGGGSETYVGLTDTEGSLIAGALQYASSSGSTLTQSANLVFDGINFGIGTSTPTSELTVDGNVEFASASGDVGLAYDATQNFVGIGTSVPGVLLDVLGGSIRQRGGTSSATYAPSLTSSEGLSGGANDIEVVGNYAFLAMTNAGSAVTVLDMSDPNNPTSVETLSLPAEASSITVAGRYAYVTTEVTGDDFHIIDISDPLNLVEVGSLNLPTSAFAVQVEGIYAYVLTDNVADEFHVVDISDRSTPNLVRSVALPDRGNALAIKSGYAYVLTNGTNDDLHVIDISDPATTTIATSINLPAGGEQIRIYGSTAYIGTGATGDDFLVYDISNPESPSLTSSIDVDGAVVDIRVYGRYAYIVTQGSPATLKVVDVSDLSSPVVVGSQTVFDGSPESVAISGRYAIVTTSAVGDDVLLYNITTVEAQSADIASALMGKIDVMNEFVSIGTTDLYGAVQIGIEGFVSDSPLYIQSTDNSFTLGSFSIGTSTASSTLTVAGSISSTDLLGGATNLTTDVNGNIIRDPSDERLKENITNIEDALTLVTQLQGVRYEWKDKSRFGEQIEIGFIAQQVDTVLPEVVRKGGDYWSLNTRNIVAVVVEAVKELWASLQTTQADVEVLQAEVAELRATVHTLQQSTTTPSISNDAGADAVTTEVSESPAVSEEATASSSAPSDETPDLPVNDPEEMVVSTSTATSSAATAGSSEQQGGEAPDGNSADTASSTEEVTSDAVQPESEDGQSEMNEEDSAASTTVSEVTAEEVVSEEVPAAPEEEADQTLATDAPDTTPVATEVAEAGE